MTVDNREIQAFLRNCNLQVAEHPEIRKAGLIAYLPGESLRYYVMTPVASKPDLGLPEFQICKGTRMYYAGTQWADMRGNVPENATLEPLTETALREGIEELGIKIGNIADLTVLGDYQFISATNRKEVQLWLLAAEMKNEHDFGKTAESTAQCRWMTLKEFEKHGRPDHAHILSLVEKKLCA